jgi:GNAT superfamily N-acetyltransferase
MQLTFSYDFQDYLHQIRQFMGDLYREDPEGEPMDDGKIRATIHHCLCCPDKLRLVVLLWEGRPVGYALLVFYWSNERGGDILHLDELYVQPEYRKMGIASALIAHLAAWDEIVALQLETTPGNEEARAFFRKQGFLPDANHHFIRVREGSARVNP